MTKARLIADYRDLADLQDVEQGDVGPTRRQFHAWVPYSATCAGYHFGSWRAFVEAAGYRVHDNPVGRKEAS